jgi:hypothetical protein
MRRLVSPAIPSTIQPAAFVLLRTSRYVPTSKACRNVKHAPRLPDVLEAKSVVPSLE